MSVSGRRSGCQFCAPSSPRAKDVLRSPLIPFSEERMDLSWITSYGLSPKLGFVWKRSLSGLPALF